MTALILTDGAPQFTIPDGDGVEIYGTAGVDSLAFAAGSNVTLDASFNAGNDVIYLEGNSTDFIVSSSGATVTLTDADGNIITIPAGTTGQTLVFGDGALDLMIDAGAIVLGDQTVTGTATPVTATVDPSQTSDSEFGVVIPPASLYISDTTVAEDGGTAIFTVVLTTAPGAGESITVDYATADGTATAGTDYTAATGTLTFAEGVLTQSITVDITDDLVLEDTETFTVSLSNAAGTIGGTAPKISDASATGTITDNDIAEFTLVAGASSVDEGSTATFTLTASATHAEGDTVNYTISGVDADDLGSGTLTGTATLGADLTAIISADLVLDQKTEGPETLTVTIDSTSTTASTTVNDTSTEPLQGQIITLTNGIDYKDGTEGADVFDGLVNAQGVATLNSSDRLDGKEGSDKLVAELNGGTIATTTTSIEDIELITTAASTFDMINTTEVDTLTIKNGVSDTAAGAAFDNALTVNNIASTDLGITQLNQPGSYRLNYTNTALAGANNVAITLNGAQSDTDIAPGGASVLITQQAGTDTSGAETITLDSIGSNSNFLASLVSQDANLQSDMTTLNVTGTQALTITNPLNASVATVNANTLTGGLTATFANAASAMSVQGGQGNDNITLNANAGNVNVDMGTGDDSFALAAPGTFNTLDVIDGGDGTDTLSLDDGDATAITAALTNISNFEALTFNSNVANASTANATFFGEIATATIAANTAGTFNLTMGAGSRTVNVGNVAGNSTLNGTLTVTDTGTATDDVLAINNTNITGATDALTNAITSAGYETVNINTGTVATAVQTTGLVTVNADSTTAVNTLNISGVNAMTLAGAVSNSSGDFIINASGMTGAATLNMGAAAARSGGVVGKTIITGSEMSSDAIGTGDTLMGNVTDENTINAGSANDTVTGGAVIDTIDLGAGNDILNASTGDDVVSGGDGNDTMTAGVGEQTLKGQAGDDTIIMGATVSAKDVVDGGEGTDTISIAAAVTAANAAGISNFETLALAGANVTQDMIQFTNNSGFVTAAVGSLNTFNFNNAGSAFNTIQVTDFALGQDGVVAANMSRLVDTSADSLTINASGTISALADAGATAIITVTANDEETITINGGELATENITIGTLLANDVTSLTLTGAGNNNIQNLIGGAANLATVDASAVAGTVTVNAANSTADMTMTGSLQGANTLTAGTGADTITGGAGADALIGGNGNDTINGAAGADANLDGGIGKDTIDGGVGADTICGGTGNDTLTGGLGNDAFYFITGNGVDTINDFTTTGAATDTIKVATASVSGDAALMAGVGVVTDTAAGAVAADTLKLTANSIDYISVNGAAANLTIGGALTLTATDLTASTLTNVAAYLGEQFTKMNTGLAGAEALIAMNWTAGGSTTTYIYDHVEDGVDGILKGELSLVGIVQHDTEVMAAGDIIA